MKSKFFKVMAIIFTVIFGAFFIINIFLLISAFCSRNSYDIYDTYYYEQLIGATIVDIIAMLVGGFIFLSPWYALASLLKDNEINIKEISYLRGKLHLLAEKTGNEDVISCLSYTSSSKDSVAQIQPVSEKRMGENWTCKMCGEINPHTSRTCKSCGHER